MIPWLDGTSPFPPLDSAMSNGLLAAGGDLSPGRLLDAYRHGIFPWFSQGEPILWWSPDPRMVLFPDELNISRSLAKKLRNSQHEISFDSRFDSVVRACAELRSGQFGTWITADMQAAYGDLHTMGYAHSVETWMNGELAGGLYGVAIGGAFYGESMFSLKRDASKLALVALVQHLRREGFGVIDCQMHTSHLASMGARDIPRKAFSQLLSELVDYPRAPGKWATVASETPNS